MSIEQKDIFQRVDRIEKILGDDPSGYGWWLILKADLAALQERVEALENDWRNHLDYVPAPEREEERCAECVSLRVEVDILKQYVSDLRKSAVTPFVETSTPESPSPEREGGERKWSAADRDLIVGRIDANTAHIVALERAVLAAGIKIDYPPRPEAQGETCRVCGGTRDGVFHRDGDKGHEFRPEAQARRVWTLYDSNEHKSAEPYWNVCHPGDGCKSPDSHITVVEQRPGETLRAVVAGSERLEHSDDRGMFWHINRQTVCGEWCSGSNWRHRRIAVLAPEPGEEKA